MLYQLSYAHQRTSRKNVTQLSVRLQLMLTRPSSAPVETSSPDAVGRASITARSKFMRRGVRNYPAFRVLRRREGFDILSGSSVARAPSRNLWKASKICRPYSSDFRSPNPET